jgi:hypothetical protein
MRRSSGFQGMQWYLELSKHKQKVKSKHAKLLYITYIAGEFDCPAAGQATGKS